MVKKITVEQLRKGMFLCGTDRKWIDLPFFRTSFLIASEKQIKTLQEYCQLVYIDTAKGLDLAECSDGKNAEATDAAPESAPSPAPLVYQQIQTGFCALLQEVRLGRALDLEKINHMVSDLLDGAAAGSPLILAQLPAGTPDVLAQKSLNVGILAAGFGHYLALPTTSLRLLVMGALLHDIGMVEIPGTIFAKTASLTPAERIVLEQHPELGVAILSKTPDLPAEVVEIVANHHEQLDSGGYPKHLSAEGISQLTRIVSIVSVYEALLGERPYREPWTPLAAMDYLNRNGQSMFDAALVASFIQMQACYPNDCVLRLQTDELAIVVNGNDKLPHRPRLRIVTNSQKQLLFEEQTLDLSLEQNRDVTIVSVLASDEPIIELLKVFAEQEKQS